MSWAEGAEGGARIRPRVVRYAARRSAPTSLYGLTSLGPRYSRYAAPAGRSHPLGPVERQPGSFITKLASTRDVSRVAHFVIKYYTHPLALQILGEFP
ncbi:unnamed protein product, partial [Iphiclides podalirius]